MPTLFEEVIKILPLFLLLRGLQALLVIFLLVGYGVSIHDLPVMNTIHHLRPEVSDEEIPLKLSLILQRGNFDIVLPSMRGTACVGFLFVMHVREGDDLASKIGDPITELVVMRRDEASLLAVKGIIEVECHATSIVMFR